MVFIPINYLFLRLHVETFHETSLRNNIPHFLEPIRTPLTVRVLEDKLSETVNVTDDAGNAFAVNEIRV